MSELNLTGSGVALVTPFTENGEIDFVSLNKLVNNVISKGVDYLVVLGTTAETPTLSDKEKVLLVKEILKYNNNRLPVVLGMGGNNTLELVKKIKEADLKGISAILSVAPYYNKPTQEGIYQHYKAIAENSPLPIILYNVPGRTGSNISAATCLRLANEFQNIVAVKEASGDMDQIMEIVKNKPQGFDLISGDDALAFPMICVGGSGVISVIANALPAEFSSMVNSALKFDVQHARQLHYKLLPFIKAIFEEGNPAGVKALLCENGIGNCEVRLPLVKASESLKNKFKRLKEFA